MTGETPNIAARLQEIAAPNSVVLSAASYRLIQGYFHCEDLGPRSLKNVSEPVRVYRVLAESGVRGRLEVSASRGLTPLVGREEELGLLLKRWEKVKEGAGQVVLLSGEAGIGKSRLLQELHGRSAGEPHTGLVGRCSPYHQNSAFYPIIDLLQRVLEFKREDSPEEKLGRLEVGAQRAVPLQPDVVPLLASLLSLPLPEGRYPPLTLTPQKQKEKTQHALLTWLVAEATRQPVRLEVEDVHWADPSTRELLGLLIDQVSMIRIFLLLTFRPEFHPPWTAHSYVTHLTLSRLGRQQAEAMVESLTIGEVLPTEAVQQVVAKADGVPLFVEELTKMVVESGAVGARHAVPLLGIPATLHDALMARLDRLGTAKEVAQLGAALGREFTYELLHAVSPVDETNLQQAVAKLVEAEVFYQQGLPPQARYLFKHALIQDAAYQSLLKSTRQQYHRQIAQVVEGRFSETKETQPELLAHHYTEAGLSAQAIPYWRQAGQQAVERSANMEAIAHLTKGLELLKTLPCIPERIQQELDLQTTLGPALMAAKGYAAPDVAQAYTRARELCQQVGETPRLLQVLLGLGTYYVIRAELQTARELGEQCLPLAQRMHDLARLLQTHFALEVVSFQLGEFALAREHFEQSIALYNPQKSRPYRALQDPGVGCLSYAALVLWSLGYPEQALKRSREALTLAQELSHPFSLAVALNWTAWLHQYRREGQLTQERAEAEIALSSEQGFPFWVALGTILRGWALAEQGWGEEGVAQIRQGLTAHRAMGAEAGRPHFLALLAEACRKVGQTEEGLTALAEALATADKTGDRFYEAELYRLRGELTLAQSSVQGLASSVRKSSESEVRGPESEIPSPQHLTPSTHAEVEQEAEECFLKAIEIAQRQQAKSLELRAAMSLARLWESQGKQKEAHNVLSEIYNWFTEGLDTKDLQEARALLDELNRERHVTGQ